MNDKLIREIAIQVFNEQIVENWKFYLIILALCFISSAIGSFLSSYFKKRGEHIAVKSDFDNLSNQLKKNTELVENVKATVNHSDWTQREWKTLRRVKLEELLTTLHSVMSWIEKDHSLMKESGEGNEAPMPLNSTVTIARLYFPELYDEVRSFHISTNQYRLAVNTLLQEIYFSSTVKPDLEKHNAACAEYLDLFEHHNIKLGLNIQRIEEKSSVLMTEIMDIE